MIDIKLAIQYILVYIGKVLTTIFRDKRVNEEDYKEWEYDGRKL